MKDQFLSLFDLPWVLLVAVLQTLPLPELLKAAVVCTQFKEAVAEVLQSVTAVDFSALSGQTMYNAILWVANTPLMRMKSITVSGHLSQAAFSEVITTERGRAFLGQLEHLTIDCCKKLTDNCATSVLAHCPNLRILDLSQCAKLSDKTAEAIGQFCTKLRVLNCKDLPNLTDSGVRHIARACVDLEEVYLDGCKHTGSDAVALLVASCKQLRTLSLARSYKVTDSGLEGVFQHQNLQNVSLKQCMRFSSVKLLSQCPRLQAVDLTGCPLVSDAELRTMLLGSGKTLKKLVLVGCERLTGNILSAIGDLCPVLETLSMRSVKNIRNKHLVALGNTCSTLKSFGVAECTKVEDAGIEAVLAKNPRLEHLEVEGLYLLTDHILELVAKHTPGLKTLNIRLLHSLTADAILCCIAATNIQRVHLSGIMEDKQERKLAWRIRQAKPSCALHR